MQTLPFRALTIAGTEDSDTGINLTNLLNALEQLPVKPLLRLCMYKGVPPEAYLPIVMTLKSHSYPIMLQPCDSQDLISYNLTQYETLFQKCIKVLSPHIDYIECGNEINGDWCGPIANLKLFQALATVGSQIPRVATLFLDNDDPDELWDWCNKNPFFAEYIFLSHYPYSSKNHDYISPLTMVQLAGRYSHSKIGIGEYGTEDGSGDEASLSKITKVLNYYETRPLKSSQDMGLGFYWDFYDDCVKNDKGTLNVLKGLWK
jgi:hypothetical protein